MYVKLFQICRYTQIKLVFIVSYDVVNDQFFILILKIPKLEDNISFGK